MKSQSIENQAKANRFVVMLKSDSKAAISKAEKDLNVQLVSSEKLNSENRAFEVMSDNTGIFYKNLNLAVVDDVGRQQLNEALQDQESPIIYWEEEREYRIADEFDMLDELKHLSTELQEKIEELTNFLREKQEDDTDEIWKNATWGLGAIGMPLSKYTGKGIDVCILDTGFYAGHPDFTNRSIEGKSFIQGEDWDFDGNGHGTHCTGTAAGNVSHDGKRYGVAHEANIKIGKVLSDAGSGSTSGIIDAIDWAVEKKYKVISMSLGSPVQTGQGPSPIFEQAGRKALESGCLLIAAAGNDSHRPNSTAPVSSPANAESIMAIAALDVANNVAWFSNGGINLNGGRVDVAAPGVDVYSAYSKNANGQLYARLNGTSMATPHVAGIAALFWEAYPNNSASDIWLKIEKAAKQLQNIDVRDVGQGLAQAI